MLKVHQITNNDFPLGTPWNGQGVHEDVPWAHRGLAPDDLGALRDPNELKRWTGIKNPVVPLQGQVIDEAMRAISTPISPTLH